MLENKSYNNKDLAEKNANLFVTALEKFSETNGIAIEDLIREEAPTIRNQSEIEGAIREAAPEASTQYAEKYIEDIYNEILGLYVEKMAELTDTLTKDLEGDDIPDYVVNVHGVKSNSRNIGAMALGDFAEVMEHAGKAGDKTFIKENHEKLLQMVSEVVAEANSILE